jgi:hypothetical protein
MRCQVEEIRLNDRTGNHSRGLICGDRERVAREIIATITGRGPYSTEFQIARADGELRMIAVSAQC